MSQNSCVRVRSQMPSQGSAMASATQSFVQSRIMRIEQRSARPEKEFDGMFALNPGKLPSIEARFHPEKCKRRVRETKLRGCIRRSNETAHPATVCLNTGVSFSIQTINRDVSITTQERIGIPYKLFVNRPYTNCSTDSSTSG